MHSTRLLLNRNFRFLVATKFLMSFAAQMQAVAVGWQIYALTRDPLNLGLIGLTEAIPSIGVSLFAGHLVDRRDPRTIYARASLICLLGSLALLLISGGHGRLTGQSQMAAIFGVIFVTGLARGFLEPSHFTLVSLALPREHLKLSAPWTSTAWQVASITGPALAGVLYAWTGPSKTYAVVVGVLALALAAGVKVSSPASRPNPRTEESFRESLASGVRFVLGHPIILAALSLDMFAVLFGGATSILPMYVDRLLHLGPMALGLLRAAPSVGAVAIAVYSLRRPVSRRAGPALLASVAGFGLCMIGFGLSHSLWLSVGLLALSGAFDNVSVMVRYTILQLAAPAEMRGRISAVNSIFLGSSNEIGEFESGVVARLMGLVPSIVFGGGMTLVVVIAVALFSPALRALDLGRLERESFLPAQPVPA